jgi:hypothetical protein
MGQGIFLVFVGNFVGNFVAMNVVTEAGFPLD